MSIPLTVGTDTFNYPTASQPPGWGEDASDWAVAVTNALGSLTNASDIPVTQVNIGNNTSAQVPGLVIDPTTVRSAVINYNCYRIASVTGPDYSEAGTIRLAYQNLAAASSKWTMDQNNNNDAGISFDVADDGQFTYTTTDLSATGILTFKASTILQNS